MTLMSRAGKHLDVSPYWLLAVRDFSGFLLGNKLTYEGRPKKPDLQVECFVKISVQFDFMRQHSNNNNTCD